jgi:hypothetical protein
MNFFLEHYALVFSVLYSYVTGLGILHSFWLYRRFGINIFDYAELQRIALVLTHIRHACTSGGADLAAEP